MWTGFSCRPHAHSTRGAPSRAVVPGPLGSKWEGAVRRGTSRRPDRSVELLSIVEPDTCPGQKDAQQAALVGAMMRDLDLPRALVRRRCGSATVRSLFPKRVPSLRTGARGRQASIARSPPAAPRPARGRASPTVVGRRARGAPPHRAPRRGRLSCAGRPEDVRAVSAAGAPRAPHLARPDRPHAPIDNLAVAP